MALSVDEGDRPQSVGAWRAALEVDVGEGERRETENAPDVRRKEQIAVPSESVVRREGHDALPSDTKKKRVVEQAKWFVVIMSVPVLFGILYIHEEFEQQPREQTASEQQRREQAALEQQRREQAVLEQQRREQAALEQQRREQAVLEQQRREQAALEQQRREQAALEQQRREQAALEEEEEIVELWRVEKKPVVIKKVEPKYPATAQKANITGKVFCHGASRQRRQDRANRQDHWPQGFPRCLQSRRAPVGVCAGDE